MRRTATLLTLLALAGCTTANLGAGAVENQTQTRSVAGGPESAYREALATASMMRWDVSNSDAVALVFSATTPGNGGRWADRVNVVVRPDSVGSEITVRSNLGQGPNRRYIAEYLDAVEAALR